MRPTKVKIFARSHRVRQGERCARGFTMIELMITIVVLAILIGLAAPSLSDLVRDQRIKTATFDVYSSLIYARSEAIKRNSTVDVIPEAPGWAGGWRVETGGTVLKRQDALSGISIAQPDSSAIGTITYRGDGRLTAAAPDIVLKASDSAATTARCVRVDLSGRPNVKVDTNQNAADGCQ